MTNTEYMTAAREMAAQCWCDPETSSIEMDSRLADAFARRLAPVLEDLETERIRLAACGVVALADTPESAAQQRPKPDSRYRSASLGDVERLVDECMRLRAQLASAK